MGGILKMTTEFKPEHSRIDKWNWMMDYCRSKQWPPGNSILWQQAEDEYFKMLEQL